jgi:hypothetical protein
MRTLASRSRKKDHPRCTLPQVPGLTPRACGVTTGVPGGTPASRIWIYITGFLSQCGEVGRKKNARRAPDGRGRTASFSPAHFPGRGPRLRRAAARRALRASGATVNAGRADACGSTAPSPMGWTRRGARERAARTRAAERMRAACLRAGESRFAGQARLPMRAASPSRASSTVRACWLIWKSRRNASAETSV